jgi:hypothetical protein
MNTLARISANQWLQRRRSYHVMVLYRDFQGAFLHFRDIYQAYADNGTVAYSELEKLVGSENDKGRLWQLKDRCHLLWRQEEGRNIEGCLLDLVLGSLFHECMKLKENIYLREKYRPQLEQYLKFLRQTPPEETPDPVSGSFQGHEWVRFLLQTGGESSSQMESLGFLFGQANFLLRRLLTEETHNKLLLRYLVEHEDQAAECWHEPLDQLFAELFYGSPELGLCGAAHSYQEGNWYEAAKKAFQRALQLNPDCHEARQQITKLEALCRLEGDLTTD